MSSNNSTSFCLPSPSTVIHPYTVGISVNELPVRGLETKQNKRNCHWSGFISFRFTKHQFCKSCRVTAGFVHARDTLKRKTR